PETPLFEKGREVFGLPQARKALRAENCAIVVEGYMDVVALSQHGIGHAVATLGTSTTPTHVQKLLRQVDRLVFCFDGDAAGRKAAWRALENALESLADNKVLAFAFLPEAEDPDSFVRAQGNAAFRNLIAQATPLSDFLLRELGRRSDLATAEGRAKLVAEAKPLIVRVPTPLLRLQLVKRLAEASGFSQQEVEKLTGLRGSTRPAPAKSPRHKPSLSRKLLRFVLRRPALAARLPRALLPVEGDEAAALLCAITEALAELPPEASYAQLREQLRGHPLEERLDALAGEWLGMGAFSAEEEDAKEAEEAEFSAALELLRQGAEQAGFADLQVKARQFGVAGLSAEEKETYLHLLMQKNNRKI
ncbi:MAG: toprim domain-containing protein, partial [Zoogloeaceae bacterium]|nr:toprim domain-containing protein [Zoogloeaceae bacterium]